MRVVIYAQDNCAAHCLGPLLSKDSTILGVAPAGPLCREFTTRCTDLGLEFHTSSDDVCTKFIIDRFSPDIVLCIPDLGEVPAVLASYKLKAHSVNFGQKAPGAPWPEFPVIWNNQMVSRVSLAQVGGAEVCSASVPVVLDETAITLRAKHMAAATRLILTLVDGKPVVSPDVSLPAHSDAVPSRVSLDWSEQKVDRFLRAHLLPPNDVAVAEDPNSGETYFIENLQQFRNFLHLTSSSKSAGRKRNASGDYVADTHWYSNVGGTIVKMSDTDIHLPRKTDAKKGIIPGATQTNRKKLRMNEPLIGPNAERYCSSALASTWIGVEGPYIKQFERHLARICGCAAACAVQSGTAALYGAMKALGVCDHSHHVLCPSYTCAACADAVVHAGGTPIPIDCELETFGISFDAVKTCLATNDKVVGVVVAPCYGVPSGDYHKIIGLCKEKGLWVCEDACESYGAWTQPPGDVAKVQVGSLATLAVVSTRSEKMIGVGEGGAILGNDTALVGKAKWWCSRAPCRGAGLWRVYEHEAVGQNFRLPEMLGAVGCAAAEMLPSMIERKRSIRAWYEKYMGGDAVLGKVKLQSFNPGDEPVWWVNSVVLPEGFSGEEVGMLLMKNCPDIEIRPGFFPLDQQAIFQGPCRMPCPNTDLLYQRSICLPSSAHLEEEDVKRVCGALADAMGQVSGKA